MMENNTQPLTPQRSPIDWDRLDALFISVSEQLKETDLQHKAFRKEYEERLKKSEEAFQKSKEDFDLRLQKLDKQMQETDRRMQETDRRMQETDRRMQETDRLIQETHRQIQETDKQVKETSAEMRRLMKRTSILDNEWGRFLEEMCVPASIEIFKKEGIGITQRYTGITHAKDDDGDEMEVDAILCNTTEAVALEVKSKCSKDDIDHFMKQLRVFKKVFHPFDRYKVYAAIVGVRFQNGVQEYARRQGLYVIDCPAEGIFSLAKKPLPEKRFCL